MTNILLVALGGAAGAVLRYVLGGWVQVLSRSTTFPYGTLAVNVVGCLGIGLLGAVAESRAVLSSQVRVFLFTGLLGGFTTFSAFGYETTALARLGDSGSALVNVGAHLVLCFGALWAGRTLGQLIWR